MALQIFIKVPNSEFWLLLDRQYKMFCAEGFEWKPHSICGSHKYAFHLSNLPSTCVFFFRQPSAPDFGLNFESQDIHIRRTIAWKLSKYIISNQHQFYTFLHRRPSELDLNDLFRIELYSLQVTEDLSLWVSCLSENFLLGLSLYAPIQDSSNIAEQIDFPLWSSIGEEAACVNRAQSCDALCSWM